MSMSTSAIVRAAARATIVHTSGARQRAAMSTLPPPTPPKYTVKNPNANFFKAAVPFLAFCAIGAYFVSRFQSERLTMSDKQRSSMSLAEAKRRDEEIAAELERIQQYVNTDWKQVPIPGSRDDPNGRAPPEAAIRGPRSAGAPQ